MLSAHEPSEIGVTTESWLRYMHKMLLNTVRVRFLFSKRSTTYIRLILGNG